MLRLAGRRGRPGRPSHQRRHHAPCGRHGLIALTDGDFVVLERPGAAVDCDLAELPEPVTLLPAG